MPAANNMEAIWAVTLLPAICGKLYTLYLIINENGWMAYFMGLRVEKHTGVHFWQHFTITTPLQADPAKWIISIFLFVYNITLYVIVRCIAPGLVCIVQKAWESYRRGHS